VVGDDHCKENLRKILQKNIGFMLEDYPTLGEFSLDEKQTYIQVNV